MDKDICFYDTIAFWRKWRKLIKFKEPFIISANTMRFLEYCIDKGNWYQKYKAERIWGKFATHLNDFYISTGFNSEIVVDKIKNYYPKFDKEENYLLVREIAAAKFYNDYYFIDEVIYVTTSKSSIPYINIFFGNKMI